MILNRVRWWHSSSGDLVTVEYFFITVYYAFKTEKRRTSGCRTKQLGLLAVIYRERKTTVIYKKYNLLLFFPFITQNIRLGRVRENRRGDEAVSLWNLSTFLCSPFYLSLFSFHKTGTGQTHGMNHLKFFLASLLSLVRHYRKSANSFYYLYICIIKVEWTWLPHLLESNMWCIQ